MGWSGGRLRVSCHLTPNPSHPMGVREGFCVFVVKKTYWNHWTVEREGGGGDGLPSAGAGLYHRRRLRRVPESHSHGGWVLMLRFCED